MIARSSNGRQICVRCQLQLLQRRLKWSTPAGYRYRQQHTEAQPNSQVDARIEPEHEDGSAEPEIPNLIRHYSPKRSQKELLQAADSSTRRQTRFPLRKIHGYSEHALRENVQGLDVDSLGRPAEVIVLKQAGLRFSYTKPAIEESEDKGEPVDIMARLDAERGLVDQAEVTNNINELRPRVQRGELSWDKFRSVEKKLHDGFTTTQLVRYIASHGTADILPSSEVEAPASDAPQLGTQQSESAIVRISKWMPGLSESGASFEESCLRGYISDIAFTQKQRLVVQLMRQCWQLEIEDLAESVGELEIQTRSKELELLINGTKPPLGSISARSILNEDEQIEVFRSRRVIRITATKEKAATIVEEIKEVLSNVRHLEIELEALRSKRLGLPRKSTKLNVWDPDDTVLTELRKLTGAEIHKLPNDKLSVTCIDSKPNSKLSTPNDVVRRLLLASSPVADSTVRRQACKEVGGPLIELSHERTEGLPWHERLHKWSRRTAGISKSEVGATSSTKHTDYFSSLKSISKTIDSEFEMHEKEMNGRINNTMPSSPRAGSSADCCWDTSYVTTSAAILGHVLHRAVDDIQPTISPAKVARKLETTFVPACQNLSRLLGLGQEASQKRPVAMLRMRFLPNPWRTQDRDAVKAHQPPPIEMSFRVDPSTKNLEIQDIVAVINSTVSDVMIPDRALDLRFMHRTTSRLVMQGAQLPQISNFRELSQLNLTRGNLITPATLIMPVASHICTQQGNASNTELDIFDIEYLFAGLEYLRASSTTFEGRKLLYTSVESGKANGRGAELSLWRHDIGDFGQDFDPAEVQDTTPFVTDAFKLIDILESPEDMPVRSVISKN